MSQISRSIGNEHAEKLLIDWVPTCKCGLELNLNRQAVAISPLPSEHNGDIHGSSLGSHANALCIDVVVKRIKLLFTAVEPIICVSMAQLSLCRQWT